jgi:hypothetical protein
MPKLELLQLVISIASDIAPHKGAFQQLSPDLDSLAAVAWQPAVAV